MSKQKLPPLSCPECGARNVEARSFLPRQPLLQRLGDIVRASQRATGGRKYLVCKDCGHTAMLQVLWEEKEGLRLIREVWCNQAC